MGTVKELTPDLGYQVPFQGLKPHELEPYLVRLAEAGQITRGESRGEIEDYIEVGWSAIKLAFLCAVGILAGAAIVVLVWG